MCVLMFNSTKCMSVLKAVIGYHCYVSLSPVLPSCLPSQLAVYSLKVETFWTEQMFPKQFPLWRPPAQWSLTVGASHGGQLEMFREGEEASQGLGHLAETGDPGLLEAEIHSSVSLLSLNTSNVFRVLPVTSGAASSQTNIFVDGRNSKVSTANSRQEQRGRREHGS